MNVLSLFDGMSCGQIALEHAGIKVNKYYASEINKYAIKVTMHNYPNTIQLGDIRNVHAKDLDKIDLVIGGSPCQGFSRAGKGLNFEDPRSVLFFEYERILKEVLAINPNVLFLLENVQMDKFSENVISRTLGIKPIVINSALVSAQNRVRLYWTNIAREHHGFFNEPFTDIPQPKDRKIFLKDILEDEVDDKYFLSEKMLNYLNTRKDNFNNGKINYKNGSDKAACINKSSKSLDISDSIIVGESRKARTFTAGGHSGGLHSDMDLIVHNTQPRTGDPKKGGKGHLGRKDGKTYYLDTGNTNAVEIVAMRGRGENNQQTLEPNGANKSNSLATITKDNLVKYNYSFQVDSLFKNDAQAGRVYSENGKSVSLKALGGGLGAKTRLYQINPSKESGGKQPYQQNRIYDSKGKSPALDTLYQGTPAIKNKSNIRRLTPKECCRLQTVPDNYFWDSEGKNIISDSRIYECLGNGWTVEVIVHIFSFITERGIQTLNS